MIYTTSATIEGRSGRGQRHGAAVPRRSYCGAEGILRIRKSNQIGLRVASAWSAAVRLPWNARPALGEVFMTPEQLTASGAGGDIMTDLRGYPLLGTDMTLEGAIFTLGAFFFHGALPVRSA